MPSEMSLDEDFAVWLGKQPLEAKKEILARLGLLRERGPNLGRPYADTVKSSAYSNMKELRIQIAESRGECCSRSTPNERHESCSVGIRPATSGGTTSIFR